MTQNINVLIPEIRTHLNSAPDITCTIYLQRALKQFCKDTGVWIVNAGSTTITPPTDTDPTSPVEVDIPDADNEDWTFPDESYLQSIKKILLGGRELERVSGAEAPKYWYDWVAQKLYIDSNHITSDSVELEVYVVLTTTKDVQEIPDFFVERYSEGVSNYAISEMMLMPNRPWSDARLAGSFLKKYQLRVSEAKVAIARQGTTGTVSIDTIPF